MYESLEPPQRELGPHRQPVVAGRDLARVPLDRLEDEICTLAGHLTAATCTWVEMVGEFDRRNGWAGPGLRSCAQWLAWRVGMSAVAAREHVRVGRALAGLPQVRAAFAAGRLSYSKVRSITRIATPELEESLVDIGLNATATQVDRVVAGYRRAKRLELRPSGLPVRAATARWDDDGSLVIRARLTAEEGALYLEALDAMRHRRAEAERAARTQGGAQPNGTAPADATTDEEDAHRCAMATYGYDENAEAYWSPAADALVAMATSALATGPVDTSGADRFQVVVHVDLDQLNAETDAAAPDRSPVSRSSNGRSALRRGRCHLRNGPCIHPETLHRISCDAILRVVLHDTDGSPLDQGRSKRLVDPKLRRALEERDGGRCRFIGCSTRHHLHAHHIRHWCRGGRTDLANLILLCGFHHRLLHEHGYGIEISGPGDFRFLRPDGSTIDASPPTRGDPWLGTITGSLHAPPVITPSTTTPGWAGEHLDLGYVVSLLFPPGRQMPAA